MLKMHPLRCLRNFVYIGEGGRRGEEGGANGRGEQGQRGRETEIKGIVYIRETEKTLCFLISTSDFTFLYHSFK